MSFCFPVKKGWQLEHISSLISPEPIVERVMNSEPHAQETLTFSYLGWILSFIFVTPQIKSPLITTTSGYGFQGFVRTLIFDAFQYKGIMSDYGC